MMNKIVKNEVMRLIFERLSPRGIIFRRAIRIG